MVSVERQYQNEIDDLREQIRDHRAANSRMVGLLRDWRKWSAMGTHQYSCRLGKVRPAGGGDCECGLWQLEERSDRELSTPLDAPTEK
jgi:hypothetical protein